MSNVLNLDPIKGPGPDQTCLRLYHNPPKTYSRLDQDSPRTRQKIFSTENIFLEINFLENILWHLAYIENQAGPG
jgi:hypothetical protein